MRASRYGVPLTLAGIEQMLQEVAKRATITGVRVSPHTFRHTFARMFLENGGDVYRLYAYYQEVCASRGAAHARIFLACQQEDHRGESEMASLPISAASANSLSRKESLSSQLIARRRNCWVTLRTMDGDEIFDMPETGGFDE